MHQPKIFLRNNNNFETKNFNFGATVHLKSWAERIGAKRYERFKTNAS